jgi:hypothetical protein
VYLLYLLPVILLYIISEIRRNCNDECKNNGFGKCIINEKVRHIHLNTYNIIICCPVSCKTPAIYPPPIPKTILMAIRMD